MCEYHSQESDLCRAVIESNWNLILTIEINEVQKKWQSTWRYVDEYEQLSLQWKTTPINDREEKNKKKQTNKRIASWWHSKNGMNKKNEEKKEEEKEPLQMVHGVIVYLMKCIHLQH